MNAQVKSMPSNTLTPDQLDYYKKEFTKRWREPLVLTTDRINEVVKRHVMSPEVYGTPVNLEIIMNDLCEEEYKTA